MADIDYRILGLLQAATPATKQRVEAVLLGKATATSAKTEAETRLVTLTDAARRLGVSRSTIGRLIKRSVFKPIPVGGKTRVALSSIIDYASGKENS